MGIYRVKYFAFGPEEIDTIAAAYYETLLAFYLPHGDDPVTRVVARKVIEIAQSGELDRVCLRTRAIAELGVPTRFAAAPRSLNGRGSGRRGRGDGGTLGRSC